MREALGDAPAPAKRRGPGRPREAKRAPSRPRKATKASTTRVRRSPDDVAAMGTTVLAHVTANPGQRLEEIGRALGEPTKGLKRPIANMLAAGMLRTEGQKRGRGTSWGAGRGGRRRGLARATALSSPGAPCTTAQHPGKLPGMTD